MKVVGNRTNQGVGDRVYAQGYEDGTPAQRPGQAEDLIVVKEEKNVEDRIFRAFGN